MASRPCFQVCSTASVLASLSALLVTGPAFSSTANAAPTSAEEPASLTSVPEPDAAPEPISPDPAPSESTTAEVPAPDQSVPEPTEGATPVVAEPSNPDPTSPTTADTPAIDPTLLDAPEPEPAAPVPTVREGESVVGGGLSPEERAEALEDAYVARYRPPENPMRLNVAGRVMFANIGGQDHLNGRMGGAAIDVGPSWNRIGVSGTLTGFGGRVLLPPDTGAELHALLGGGLTLSLGRLALMSHGYADLRVGYDVFYGVVNQRSDAPSILAPQAEDPRVVAELTQNLVPHGPRVRLDLGLAGAGNRRYFHGFGISIGYQALVGSFKGDMPMTNMLTLGLSYWMG